MHGKTLITLLSLTVAFAAGGALAQSATDDAGAAPENTAVQNAPAVASEMVSEPVQEEALSKTQATASSDDDPVPAKSDAAVVEEGAQNSAAPASEQDAEVSAENIKFIRVEGTQRVEDETVRAYMVVREGMPADSRLIDQSVKTLFASGLFADVSIRREDDGLIVTVVENPIINRISFEGNKKIADDKLSGESSLRPRLVFTRAKVQDDVERFLELYRRAGRFSARIEPKVVQLPQNRVDLIFEITEGATTGIRSINFIGNEAFDDGRLLEEIMTSESRWWKFLSSNDNYDPDRIAYDRELLRQFYLGRGYADFSVISSTAELTRDGDAFFITFNLSEGDIYAFGESTVDTSLPKIQALDLSALIKHMPGDRYDARKIDATVDIITKLVGEQGFAFAEVRPRVRRNAEDRIVTVTYVIEEGPRVYVERININGNTRTHDDVVRREMDLSEGDGFNRVLLSRSERSIKGLNYFSTVDIVEEPGTEPDQTIIEVDVKEQSTGELTLGVGFSSSESFSTQFSIAERNLLGRGQKLAFSVNVSSEVQRFNLGLTEPYFLDRDLTAGFNIFNSAVEYDNEDIDYSSMGASFNVGFPTSDDARLGLNFSIQQVEENYGLNNYYSYLYNRAVSFDLLKVIAGFYYYIDKRDDFIDTTEGWSFSAGQELAGFGGDVNFLRTSVTGDYYYPIAEGYVFHTGLEYGHIHDFEDHYVRRSDRFFKGGTSFRGFDRSGVGPRAMPKPGTSGQEDAVGANMFIIGTSELTLPLGIPKEIGMKTKLFTDYGFIGKADDPRDYGNYIIEDDFAFRATAGLSVSWKSPIGPIQFDFARVIKKEDYDDDRFFRFSAGTRF